MTGRATRRCAVWGAAPAPRETFAPEILFGTAGRSLSIRHDPYDRTAFMPGVFLAGAPRPLPPGPHDRPRRPPRDLKAPRQVSVRPLARSGVQNQRYSPVLHAGSQGAVLDRMAATLTGRRCGPARREALSCGRLPCGLLRSACRIRVFRRATRVDEVVTRLGSYAADHAGEELLRI
jgi:hypothetical protein